MPYSQYLHTKTTIEKIIFALDL